MIKWWLVTPLLVLTLFQSAYADDISGSAQIYWRTTSTAEEHEKEKSWYLSQTYNLGLSKDVTPNISFSGDLGINTTESDETKTTRMYPSFRLNLINEYFDANGGYQLYERGLEIFGMPSDETRRTNETWNTNLSTKSTTYPKLRFRYDKNRLYDHLSIHETDTRSERYEATADYTYQFLNFSVKHYKDVSDNFVADSTQTTTNDEGRVEFRKSFWDNRFTSSGSYRWNEQETESEARGQDVRSEVERQAGTGWYGVAGTQTGIPILGWTEENKLVDKREPDPPINLNTLPQYQNVRIDLNSAEDVELIYLWTTAPVVGFDEDQYEWDVYYSTDAVTWTSITATVIFEEDENRFKFSFAAATNARYFRVVNTQNDNTDLYVTEIEAFGVTTQAAYTTDTTTTTRENIIFNAGLRPVDWGVIQYDFTQDESETDPDSSKTRRYTHTINARADADLHKYLTAWAQYNTRIEDGSETEKRTTDTYSLHFDSSPLDMLSTSLSFNHSVPKIESKTQSRTTYSLLHVVAKLHEGVDLSMDGNLNYTEDVINDTETLTRMVDSDLRLELTKTLTTEIRYTTNWTNTDNSDGTETSARNSTIRTDVSYRPVRDFYFRWTYERDRDKEGEGPSSNEYALNWVMTEKLRLNMYYSVDRDAGVTRRYYSELTWNLSKVFFLTFQYDLNRQKADTVKKTQTFTSLLSAKF
jgi:hypothetical protein